MSDRRRIVTISPTGTVTTLEDFEDNATLYSVRDSFTVKPGDRNQNQAMRARRYGGATTTFETHGNGSISWTCLVRGTSADNVFTNVETAVAVLEQARTDMFFEWRPDGATNSVYYEIRGPATWTPKYSWVEFLGAKSMTVDISIPVAPLARKTSSTISLASTTLPATYAPATAVGGRAPALADLTVNVGGSAFNAAWAMFAWTKRPTSSTIGGRVPFGVLDADSADVPDLSWSVVSDANYRGGDGLEITLSGGPAGSGDFGWIVDPATMQPDDFSDEIVLEVWCRYKIATGVVNPRIALTAYPTATGQAIVFSPEWGSSGRPLVKGASATVYRHARLGTVTLPVDTANPGQWTLGVLPQWDAASTGIFGVDYVAVVPARQRCLSPSGKQLDGTYPYFIRDTTASTKTVKSDLSATIDSPPVRDGGLGGSPIELPPGTISLFAMVDWLVPDDPNIGNLSSHLGFVVSGSLKVTPREFLASD